MLPDLFTILKNDAAVTALVATRIYRHGEAPQGVAAPYVTWFLIAGVPQNTLDEVPRVDMMAVQVDCWSENTGDGSRQIEVLARAVRDAIEPHAHMTAIPIDTRDTETKRYRIGMTFDFWKDREPSS